MHVQNTHDIVATWISKVALKSWGVYSSDFASGKNSHKNRIQNKSKIRSCEQVVKLLMG